MLLQKPTKQKWINIVNNICNRISLTTIAIFGKLIFLTRDIFIWSLNIIYIIVLLPLNMLLVILQLLLKTLDSDPELTDLKTLQKLFWKGAPISLGSKMSTLCVPHSLVEVNSGQNIFDATKPIRRMWKPSTQLSNFNSNLQTGGILDQQQPFPIDDGYFGSRANNAFQSQLGSRMRQSEPTNTTKTTKTAKITKITKWRHFAKQIYSNLIPEVSLF